MPGALQGKHTALGGTRGPAVPRRQHVPTSSLSALPGTAFPHVRAPLHETAVHSGDTGTQSFKYTLIYHRLIPTLFSSPRMPEKTHTALNQIKNSQVSSVMVVIPAHLKTLIAGVVLLYNFSKI